MQAAAKKRSSPGSCDSEAVFPGTQLTPHAYLRLSSEHTCVPRQEE